MEMIHTSVKPLSIQSVAQVNYHTLVCNFRPTELCKLSHCNPPSLVLSVK